MSNYTPTFKPTNKRRSFRPSTFRPLDASSQPPSLATLSDNLRATLMNVGMRVRKSVPEGYKNSSSKTPFSIYEQTVASHPELLPYADSTGPRQKALLPPIQLSETTVRDVHSENAMTDEQVAATVDDVLSGLDAELGYPEGGSLTSSQESNTSTVSNVSSIREQPIMRRKRSLGGEEAENGEDRWNSVPMERDVPLRQIAQPRSRRPQAQRTKSGKSVRFAAFLPDEDFGEADFLMPDHA